LCTVRTNQGEDSDLIETTFGVLVIIMNVRDLTPHQLRRAASIKEQIDALNKELHGLFGGSPTAGAGSVKKRTMSAAVRRKIATAQRARWAKLRRPHA